MDAFAREISVIITKAIDDGVDSVVAKRFHLACLMSSIADDAEERIFILPVNDSMVSLFL